MKRTSTFRKPAERKSFSRSYKGRSAERFFGEMHGTCLGALYEHAEDRIKVQRSTGVNGHKRECLYVTQALCDALSRVVPPDSGPLRGGRRATLLNTYLISKGE